MCTSSISSTPRRLEKYIMALPGISRLFEPFSHFTVPRPTKQLRTRTPPHPGTSRRSRAGSAAPRRGKRSARAGSPGSSCSGARSCAPAPCRCCYRDLSYLFQDLRIDGEEVLFSGYLRTIFFANFHQKKISEFLFKNALIHTYTHTHQAGTARVDEGSS